MGTVYDYGLQAMHTCEHACSFSFAAYNLSFSTVIEIIELIKNVLT